MALNQGNQGQIGKMTGANLTASFGEYQETLVSELQPRYYELAYRSQIYVAAVAAAAPTAYTGAAGGTPLIGVWNPPSSGKNLIMIQAGIGVVAAASAAGLTQFRLYAGVTANVTGTLSNPLSTFNWATAGSGSVARFSSNTASTSSTALNYILTLGNYYWGASGGSSSFLSQPIVCDLGGSIIIPPGSMIGMGAVTVPTSMTNDAWLLWAESYI